VAKRPGGKPGLCRFPHGGDISMTMLECGLNNRPGKCLEYRTTAEVFFKQPKHVALEFLIHHWNQIYLWSDPEVSPQNFKYCQRIE
jgi:hypothetical protein